MHHCHTPEIDVTSATEASAFWAMEDMLRWPDGSELHGYGHYHETYTKVGSGWLIQTSTLTRLRIDFTPATAAERCSSDFVSTFAIPPSPGPHRPTDTPPRSRWPSGPTARAAVDITVSEHHGSPDGYLPSPVPMLAAMAARTTNVRFMIAALIAPVLRPAAAGRGHHRA